MIGHSLDVAYIVLAPIATMFIVIDLLLLAGLLVALGYSLYRQALAALIKLAKD